MLKSGHDLSSIVLHQNDSAQIHPITYFNEKCTSHFWLEFSELRTSYLMSMWNRPQTWACAFPLSSDFGNELTKVDFFPARERERGGPKIFADHERGWFDKLEWKLLWEPAEPVRKWAGRDNEFLYWLYNTDSCQLCQNVQYSSPPQPSQTLFLQMNP